MLGMFKDVVEYKWRKMHDNVEVFAQARHDVEEASIICILMATP